MVGAQLPGMGPGWSEPHAVIVQAELPREFQRTRHIVSLGSLPIAVSRSMLLILIKLLINLRRSATEAQLGLEFGSVSKMEFGFRCQIQLRFHL